MLGEFLLGCGADGTFVVEYNGAGGTGPLVQGQNVLVHVKMVWFRVLMLQI
jgi:hypothetical protein